MSGLVGAENSKITMAKLFVKNRYGIAPNELLQNPNISLKAKGLFTYMQSKPDNWNFSSERISQETKDGTDAIESAMRELESAGFLLRKKTKDQKGQWEWEHILGVEPFPENPGTGSPGQGNAGIKQTIQSKKEEVNNTITIFSWQETKEKMMAVEGSDMDIIATFLEEKKIIPTSREQLTGYIKRYRKIAKDIVPFVGKDFQKFWKAVEMCKEESVRIGYNWDLSTIYKKITKI